MTARRWLAAAAVLALTSSAAAAPRGAAAKAAFDRGVAAYQKGDFAAASEALGQSYKLEADMETLFAWAQSERQLERCEKAIELFTKLLELDLPGENRKVVLGKIDECKLLLGEQKPAEPAPPPEPAAPPPEPAAAPAAPPPSSSSSSSPAWWRDPIGGGLVIGGVVGVGVGAGFLLSARSARSDRDAATSYRDFDAADDKVQSRGRIGVIAAIAGGALIAGGVARYALRGGRGEEQRSVTAWVTPDGGGLAAFGRF